MTARNYANAPATTLTASCSAVATTIDVASVSGLPISYPYTLIIDRGTASEEAVSVTNASSLSLTVDRGIDSTTAFAHSSGAEVVHGITAQDVREPNDHINATDGVHGVTGDVVGTSDTQTLTGKTLDLTSNTLSGTVAQFNTALSDGNFVTSTDLWAAYVPALTGFLPGAGPTYYGRYVQIGKTVHFKASCALGTGFTVGDPALSLPVAANTTTRALATLTGYFGNAGVTTYSAVCSLNSGSVSLWIPGSNGIFTSVTGALPFSWGVGDLIEVSGTYEAA